jgi:hypothetical protein
MATVELQDNQFAFVFQGRVVQGMLQNISMVTSAESFMVTYELSGVVPAFSHTRSQRPTLEPSPAPEPQPAPSQDRFAVSGRRLLPLEDAQA